MKKLMISLFALFLAQSAAFAEQFHIKYSSNYLMPAYVNFENGNGKYSIEAKINVPLYKIIFNAKGLDRQGLFQMLDYRDNRNGKPYALALIQGKQIKYGKAKNKLNEEALSLPTFDLFSLAFQLSYYDKLPSSFQTTNGKKLYPSENVVLRREVKTLKTKEGNVEEITYRFRTADKKDITVKKHLGEKFPRYIAYQRDGDNYELTFDRFEK